MSLGIDTSSIDSDSACDSETESETDSGCEMVVDMNSIEVDCEKEQECLTKCDDDNRKLDTDLESSELPFNKQDEPVATMTRVKLDQLFETLKLNNWNWFSFVGVLKLEEFKSLDQEVLDQLLLDFAFHIPKLALNTREEELVEKSRQAYLYQRTVKQIDDEELDNEDSTSEADEDDPEEWVRVGDPLQGPGKELLLRKIKAARRKR